MTDALTPTEEEKAAIARLAFTDDGRLAHRYLRRVLETCEDFAETSTLLTHNGRRSLARDLMRLMAEGIEASSGRTGSTDDPILTRTRGAAAVAPARGARGFRAQLARERAAEPADDTSNSGAA